MPYVLLFLVLWYVCAKRIAKYLREQERRNQDGL